MLPLEEHPCAHRCCDLLWPLGSRLPGLWPYRLRAFSGRGRPVGGACADRPVRGPSLAMAALALAAINADFAQASDAIYRFYNRESGTHFYTVSVAERDGVVAAFPQFAYEGATFAAHAQPAPGAVPVFRFYNTKTGTHFYTSSPSERDGILAYYPAFVVREHRVLRDAGGGRRRPHPALPLLQPQHGHALLHGIDGGARQGRRDVPALHVRGHRVLRLSGDGGRGAAGGGAVERRLALPAAVVVRRDPAAPGTGRRDRRRGASRGAVRDACQRLSRQRVSRICRSTNRPRARSARRAAAPPTSARATSSRCSSCATGSSSMR